MKRSVSSSFVIAGCLTISLVVASVLLLFVFFYPDKSIIPLPVIWALLPGLTMSLFFADHRWLALIAAITVESSLWTLGAYLIVRIYLWFTCSSGASS